jgi:gluconokinase
MPASSDSPAPGSSPPGPSRAQASTRTIVLMGVSGSGKSTVMAELAKRLGWPTAEGDTFHSKENIAKMAAGHALTDEDRWPWLRSIAAWIGERETAGENGLVTCSALRRTYRDLLREGHPSVAFACLTAPTEVLAERIEGRTGSFMPVSLLQSQLDTLEPLAADEPGVTLPPDRPVAELAGRIIHDLVRRPGDAPASPEDRIVAAFIRDGRLVSIPAQGAKRQVILRYLLDHCFAEDRAYPEPEVNRLLGAYNPDVAALRRYMIDAGLMTRSGGEYRRAAEPPAIPPAVRQP